MTTVSEKVDQSKGQPVFICDFSPPRGADFTTVSRVREVGADFVCVAYSPGKSVRVDSAMMAHAISGEGGQDVMFNLATRDMNRLAIQTHLLGAHALGLENVVVLQGDAVTDRDRNLFKDVSDYQPSRLIREIVALNQGLDFRGLRLRVPTRFCVGAVIDLSKGIEEEARRAQRKVEAGAEFFLVQTFHRVKEALGFHRVYRDIAGEDVPKPLFYGLPILDKEGVMFGDVPEAVRRDLDAGRPGVEIAVDQLRSYLEHGMTTIYVVPPILRGGRRDYAAARDVLKASGG